MAGPSYSLELVAMLHTFNKTSCPSSNYARAGLLNTTRNVWQSFVCLILVEVPLSWRSLIRVVLEAEKGGLDVDCAHCPTPGDLLETLELLQAHPSAPN